MKHTQDFNSATLTLFNAILIKKNDDSSEYDFNLLKRMLSNGYLVDSNIDITPELLIMIESKIGIGGEKMNATFHKSWYKVATAPIWNLVAEQVAHYITTYGFASLGWYNENCIYIPKEALNVPDFDVSDLPLVMIVGLSESEIIEKVLSMGSSGVALSKSTVANLMKIVEETSFTANLVKNITNREFYTALADWFDIVPNEPVAYLRYVIYRLTGETLLIKNDKLIEKIKQSDFRTLDSLLSFSPDNLGSIFFRYKPLFLAMKSISKNKGFFNRLRKRADYLHKPLGEDYLNSVTSHLENGTIRVGRLGDALNDASIWRKIRLLNALRMRMDGDLENLVIKVRNGKDFVKPYSFLPTKKFDTVYSRVLSSVLDHVRLGKGDVVYIPENIHYALPATEKQFVGNIPTNSYVSVPNNTLVGIHWYNGNGGTRWDEDVIDLDLSLTSLYGEKLGWDGRYRNSEKTVFFSGDMTSAPLPNGASEFFYISNGLDTPKLIHVNIFSYYRYRNQNNTECQFIVASDSVNLHTFEMGRNSPNAYVVDPNKIIFNQFLTLEDAQTTLGMVLPFGEGNRVYLMGGGGAENSITSRSGKFHTEKVEFYMKSLLNTLELKDILELAGVKVVSEIPEDMVYTDLSPEALTKDSILNLFA